MAGGQLSEEIFPGPSQPDENVATVDRRRLSFDQTELGVIVLFLPASLPIAM
jgi:hypothetical protein